MIALEVFVQGKFMTFRELLVYFEHTLAFVCSTRVVCAATYYSFRWHRTGQARI